MKCCLGLLTVELHFEKSQSLKDRRKILNSLKERLQHRFNVSIAEAESCETWQRAGLMISCAASNPSAVDGVLRTVLQFIEADPRVMAITPEIRYYE
jgi:uncharacterized protein YlxP (DUF503 family)